MNVSLSLRTRLTLWYSLALILALTLFGAIVVWQQQRIGLGRLDRELTADAGTLANVYVEELRETPDTAAAAREVQRSLAMPGRTLAILDARGRTLASTFASPPAIGIEPVTFSTVAAQGGPWRMRLERRVLLGRTFNLAVAIPMTGLTFERREAEEALWVGIPVAWLIAVIGGLWLASSGLRPLTEMAGRAASIPVDTTQDLGAPRRDDEIGQLTTSFNALVGRLRQALSVQRQFMADASHELRTPVSVIQAASDVTLGRACRQEVEYRDALQIAGDQARRLGRLVDDMLVLARADAGGYPLKLAPLDLDDLIVDACRTIDPLARARDVSLHLDRTSGIRIEGDEELLSRMLINLLQNGVRHTRSGTDVSVSIASTPHQAAIRIADHGPGVAEPDRGRIFERFVRVDPSRTGGGAGLGLPIARWIAEAHGGALALEQSGPSGSTFVVFLPVAAPNGALA